MPNNLEPYGSKNYPQSQTAKYTLTENFNCKIFARQIDCIANDLLPKT